jgi:micrococcal nuclease
MTAAGFSYAQNWYAVKWVNDGDTMVLANGSRVRFIGINAPEIDHENRQSEPYGYQARSFTQTGVSFQKIRLEFDQQRRDRYGRLLAYVFLPDGSLLNEQLLQTGLAFFLYRKPNLRYEKRLLKAQQNAMRARRGLWQKWKEKKGQYIGNKKSRRVHLATCPYGETIKSKNRIPFSTKWEAFYAGYAPAKKCIKEFWSYD